MKNVFLKFLHLDQNWNQSSEIFSKNVTTGEYNTYAHYKHTHTNKIAKKSYKELIQLAFWWSLLKIKRELNFTFLSFRILAVRWEKWSHVSFPWKFYISHTKTQSFPQEVMGRNITFETMCQICSIKNLTLEINDSIFYKCE